MDWWRSSAGVAGLLVLPLCCAVLLLPLQSAQAWSLAATATPSSDSSWSPVVAGRASTVAGKASTTTSFGRQLNRKLFRHVIPFKLKASLCFEWMTQRSPRAASSCTISFFSDERRNKNKIHEKKYNQKHNTTLLLQWNFCSLSWMWERWVKIYWSLYHSRRVPAMLDCWQGNALTE